MEFINKNANEKRNGTPKQKSVFTNASSQQSKFSNQFNPYAKPFTPSSVLVGPSQLPVNYKVWQTIATDRVLPELPSGYECTRDEDGNVLSVKAIKGPVTIMPHRPAPIAKPKPAPIAKPSLDVSLPHCAFDFAGFANNNPPAFDSDPNRHLLFRREFGPVATHDGYIDIRLRHGINVILSLERGVLIENGDVRIAVSADTKYASLEHPNGRVRQVPDRIDIVAFDGYQKNNFVRFAKMWKNSISLTAHGCCLTYLVDPAGTRTTSDQVNRVWNKDYCRETLARDRVIHTPAEVEFAAADYNYSIEEDETETFTICGVRVSQTRDGMVRVVCNGRYSIRTSVENRSVTLNTHNIYSTASMSDSPHLFVRHFERRIHFDGANFIVRNLGHSASFDPQNLLRIH